jgi:hypothetical protein
MYDGQYVIHVTDKSSLEGLLDALKTKGIMLPSERKGESRPDIGSKKQGYDLGLRVDKLNLNYGTIEFYRADPDYRSLPIITDSEWRMQILGDQSNMMLL